MNKLSCDSCGSKEFIMNEQGSRLCKYCGAGIATPAKTKNKVNLKIILPLMAVFVCVVGVVAFSQLGKSTSDSEDSAGFSYYGEIIQGAMEINRNMQNARELGLENIEIVEPWTLEIYKKIRTAQAVNRGDSIEIRGEGDDFYELLEIVGEPNYVTRMEPLGDSTPLYAQWTATRFGTQVYIIVGYIEETGVITHKDIGSVTADSTGIPRTQEDNTANDRSISDRRNEFEERHAVTPEQERWLAFAPFVPVMNGQSARTLELTTDRSHARNLLRSSWNVTDHTTAITQLENLSSASGQSPRGNEIWRLIREDNGVDYTELAFGFLVLAEMIGSGESVEISDEDIAIGFGVPISELQNLYRFSSNNVSDTVAGFNRAFGVNLTPEKMRRSTEFIIMAHMANVIAEHTEVFEQAKNMLINSFNYTEEEIMSVETLAAWDFGRTSIIARYGYTAGYISEDEAWHYLKLAADNAHPLYNSWREYAAAHILGRAIAFGNNSRDMNETLFFLLTADRSPFKAIEY